MMFSVADIMGLNPVTRKILANAAGAVCGMADVDVEMQTGDTQPGGDHDGGHHHAGRDEGGRGARGGGIIRSCSTPSARAGAPWSR